MKVICKLSGIEYDIFTEHTDPGSGKKTRMPNFHAWNIVAEHPIFSLPTAKLLEKVEDWAGRKLSDIESRLLFLALLKSTELVEFKSTALPSKETIEKHMEYLFQTVLWMSNISNPFLCHCTKYGCTRIHLPHIIVSASSATHRLENIGIWLRSWNDIKESWYTKFETREIQDQLKYKEDLLARLIKSSSRNEGNFLSKLADWAMDASGILPTVAAKDGAQLSEAQEDNNALREYWKYLFKLKGFALYNQRAADLDELLDHMCTNLKDYAGSIYSKAVLDHLRTLVAKNAKGILGAIEDIGDDGEIDIIQDDIGSHNRKIIALAAPLLKPAETDIGTGKLYETKIAYYNALSAWKLKVSEEQKNIAIREKFAAQQAENLLAITTEDEQEAEAIDDDLETLRTEFSAALSSGIEHTSDNGRIKHTIGYKELDI